MNSTRSTKDAVRIIEHFESLSVERRLEVFRKLSARAREQLVQTLKRPHEITSLVSEEEMFFTIKELGEENAPGLIRATTDNQLKYILDLDLWKRDVFLPSAASRWMGLISGIGEGKILQFMRSADPELVQMVLSRFIEVKLRNPDIDLSEQRDQLPSFSLDEIFFVEFLDEANEDAIKRFLEQIFNWNPEFYYSLMSEVAAGSDPENEQTALKWRQARLADHGFPDFDEAIGIYAYLRPDAAHPSFAGPVASGEEEDEQAPLLQYPLKAVQSGSLLHRCLDTIDDPEEKDRLAMDLARLANKVMVADARDPGSVQDIMGAVEKVAGYINLALERACGKDISAGADLLCASHVELLFKRGFSLVLDLAGEARRLIERSQGTIDDLGYPLSELLRGLLSKRPVYAAHALGEHHARDFRSLEELKSIRQLMESATKEDRWEPL